MASQRLTDISSATGVTLSDFIHIVITGDTSQDSAGSSYKASLQQVYDAFSISNSVFTGNTSATCITDLYVTNLNSCSPLYIQPTNVGDVYIGSGGGVNLGIGTSTPSEKLDVVGNVNINGQIYVDIPTTHLPTGTTQTINWDQGNYQIIDLDSATGNVTLTFTNAKAGAVYSLQVIQGSVTRSLVYPGSIKWEGGTPLVPTSGNDAIDLITMVYNGTDFLASYGSAYS
jgi:hypothetical protein